MPCTFTARIVSRQTGILGPVIVKIGHLVIVNQCSRVAVASDTDSGWSFVTLMGAPAWSRGTDEILIDQAPPNSNDSCR